VHREDANFKLFIPLISGSECPKNQLSEWKIEFEVLHRFPAAPVYTVVARAWVDPWILAHASSIDLPSTEVPPPHIDYKGREINPFYLKPIARVDFLRITHGTNVHIWRSAVRAILCGIRLLRMAEKSKLEEEKKLQRDIRILNARNENEKQIIQMDLMMRTIGTMNEWMLKGAFQDEQRQLKDELMDQIKKLEQKTAVAATSNVGGGGGWGWLAGSSPTAQSTTNTVELEKRVDDLKNSMGKILNRLSDLSDRPAEPSDRQSQPPPATHRQLQPPPAMVSTPPTARSLEEVMQTRRRVATTKSIPVHVPDEPITPPSTIGTGRTHDQGRSTEEQSEVVQDTGGMGGMWTSAVNAFWGALPAGTESSSVEPTERQIRRQARTDSSSVEHTERQIRRKATRSAEGSAEESVIPEPQPVRPMAPKKPVSPPTLKSKKAAPKSPTKSPAKSPTKSPTKKPAKAIGELQAKQAKAEMIMKLKVLEAKRKAEIAKRDAELVKFAKAIPAVDRYKFPGMPGPPPFKPKAAMASKPGAGLLPTSLIPEDVGMEEE